MKSLTIISVLALLWLANIGRADEEINVSWAEDETNCTVITSTTLKYDQKTKKAVFKHNVEVTSPELHLTANILTVTFNKDNKPVLIEAQDEVKIKYGENEAAGDKATYDITLGIMKLTGHPWVRYGRDKLMGGNITFWRDSDRILCEPNARLVLYSERMMDNKP